MGMASVVVDNTVARNTSETSFLIFSSVFSTDEEVLTRKNVLVSTFNNSAMFKDEYFVFFLLVKDHTKIQVNVDFLKMFLQTNRAILQKSANVDLSKYRISEIDPYVEFVNSCVQLFEDCSKNEVAQVDYDRAIEMHKMEYINKQALSTLEESATILSEGLTVGNRTFSGYDDMRLYSERKFFNLDTMTSKSERKGLITYTEDDDEDEEESRVKRITTFGITGLDKAIGGIYQGDMVSLLAPAKGCKSRFATYVLHNAIVNHSVNIAMWSVENGYKGWEYLIRARHFNWFYNRNVTDVSQKRLIDSDMIRKGELSPEYKELELASWADLRFNQNYGRMINIDADMTSETFIKTLETAVDQIGADLICLDYLQLVSGKDSKLNKVERIGEAYKETLQFLKRRKIGGIFPGQLKQSVVGDIQRIDPEELINMELRDSAGESYEVIKTPDVNLALYGTVEDIRNGNMKLLSIPSRNSAPFQPIDLHVDAGTCTFFDVSA